MSDTCEFRGCNKLTAIYLKGYRLCQDHGDQILDSMREAQLSLSRLGATAVAQLLDGSESNAAELARRGNA